MDFGLLFWVPVGVGRPRTGVDPAEATLVEARTACSSETGVAVSTADIPLPADKMYGGSKNA